MPRKSMTEEQRVAASKRLVKARAARAKNVPDYGQANIHPSLRTLPDDDELSPKKVKQWINTQKELAILERKGIRQKVKGAIANHASHEAYVKNLQRYLRTGDWVDDFYGEHQQEKVRHRCIALAYDADGLPKRNIGTFYPDLGCVYTKDMSDLDRKEL